MSSQVWEVDISIRERLQWWSVASAHAAFSRMEDWVERALEAAINPRMVRASREIVDVIKSRSGLSALSENQSDFRSRYPDLNDGRFLETLQSIEQRRLTHSIALDVIAAYQQRASRCSGKHGLGLDDALQRFTEEFSQYVDNGQPELKALKNICEKGLRQHPIFRAGLPYLIDKIENGKTLSEAMTEYPQVFPRYYVSLIQSGELRGDRGLVLHFLAGKGPTP